MNPISFPEQTDVLAKAQPQYRVLPICAQQYVEEGQKLLKMTCRYELSDLEIQQIIKTRSLFISQFGDCFHPIYPQIDSPFLVCKILYKKTVEGNYNFWVPQKDAEELVMNGVALETAIDEILAANPGLLAEQILFFPKPSLGIDAEGNLKMM